ncbi:hypothetical protein GCM10017673_10390 [Streptosporangium violaceochromogenes]|nr:hypothetical protein GCM10017673_10390 [Streptosporangium violaceochromogenes]
MTIGRPLLQGAALGVLALADLVLIVPTLIGTALTALGFIFFFPPVTTVIRWRTGVARSLSGRWLDMRVRPSYMPPPPPPQPQADGWYRHDRHLYKTPWWPAWNNRWKWMFTDPATWRDMFWLLFNPVVGGVLLLLPVALVAYGLAMPWYWIPQAAPLGLAIAAAGVASAPWLLRFYAWWTRLLLSPTAASILAGHIRRLDQVRLETVDSQAAELRRIERDLHDGTQARLVAIGMMLGAVEELMDSDPTAAKVLLAKVREGSSTALIELRDLVKGIHPPVLAERGLGDAVRALALDSPLKVTVTVDLKKRLDAPVESAVYFSVSELLTNAARHGGAERVWIDISNRGRSLRVTVGDDGSGGADPARGSGLSGIERRLAAFDGVLALSSPPGGPTAATIDLPHVLPEPTLARPPLPRWKLAIVSVGWGLAWLPLFPQGIVTMIMKLVGADVRSWFLALYLPEPWQWPLIAFNIVLGLTLYGLALGIPIAHARRYPEAPNAGICAGAGR